MKEIRREVGAGVWGKSDIFEIRMTQSRKRRWARSLTNTMVVPTVHEAYGN